MGKTKIKPQKTELRKGNVSAIASSSEPDFRTNPSGWLGWNMRVYGNDFETAKTLLCQRMRLMSF